MRPELDEDALRRFAEHWARDEAVPLMGKVQASIDHLRNMVTIHQDTIVQQREALLAIQKERDDAREENVFLNSEVTRLQDELREVAIERDESDFCRRQLEKERDHARGVAARLWCSDGLPTELYDVIKPWIPKGDDDASGS